jgi:VWFA-related protein
MPSLRPLVSVLAALLAAAAGGAQTPSEPPLPTDIEEKIEVRLVTLDVVAMDGAGRTVADLARDDVDLMVDGTPTPIDAWDLSCSAGPEADPTGKLGAWPTPTDLAEGTRRVVLAFDYLHLPTAPCPDGGPCLYHTKALQDYQRVLAAKTDIGDEEMMVVALTGGLRVEQPLTRDHAAVVATLHRMEHDVTLWNGNFTHLTEEPLFDSLRALVNVLGAIPGPKAVVFISAGPGPGDRFQLFYENLAADASVAQVSFFTVDCRGLDTATRFT